MFLEDGSEPRVEILNFATPGYRPVAWLYQVQHVVGAFEPDWVVVASAKHVWNGATTDLAAALAIEIPIGTPGLRALAVACAKSVGGGDREARRNLLRKCLAPENHRLIEVVAAEMAKASRERGFRLAYLQLPTFGTKKRAADASFVEVLEAAGFEHLDVSDCWKGHGRHALRVASWDLHPNPFAHGLIAACALEPVRGLLASAP